MPIPEGSIYRWRQRPLELGILCYVYGASLHSNENLRRRLLPRIQVMLTDVHLVHRSVSHIPKPRCADPAVISLLGAPFSAYPNRTSTPTDPIYRTHISSIYLVTLRELARVGQRPSFLFRVHAVTHVLEDVKALSLASVHIFTARRFPVPSSTIRIGLNIDFRTTQGIPGAGARRGQEHAHRSPHAGMLGTHRRNRGWSLGAAS